MRIPIAISVSVLVGAAPLVPAEPHHRIRPPTLTAAPDVLAAAPDAGAELIAAVTERVAAVTDIGTAGVPAPPPTARAGTAAPAPAPGPASAHGPVPRAAGSAAPARGPVQPAPDSGRPAPGLVLPMPGPFPPGSGSAAPASGSAAPGSGSAAPAPAPVAPASGSAAPGPAAAGAAPVPQVSVAPRSTARWSFGTAVRPAPRRSGAYPRGWLYLAHRQRDRWQVALQGEPSFARLSAHAPILGTTERRILAGQAPAVTGPPQPVPTDPAGGAATGAAGRAAAVQPLSDRRTGMRLPFAVGQRWRYTSGPHPMRGSVRSSIDLAGGDGRVLAARGGLAYTMCRNGRGWIRVVHDRGFATDYYHLAGNIRPNGRPVAEGAFLGMIGNDVSCGGATTGKHVHFSLLRGGNHVPIDRYSFGKWIIRASRGSYDGTAWHGSTGVRAGAGIVYNYGRLGLTQGVVDTDGGRVLNRRAGPGAGHPVVGTVPDGATVTVTCSRRGSAHTGRNAYTSNLWNKLADGGWVSDVFVSTGTALPVAGLCP